MAGSQRPPTWKMPSFSNPVICFHVSVANIPEHYTINSNGITQRKLPEVLGRYSLMATSHQNVTSIIYKQDNGSFYLLNNTRGLVVGNESMSLIRNMLIEQSSYFKFSGFVNKFFWQVRVGNQWIYDDRLHIAIYLKYRTLLLL